MSGDERTPRRRGRETNRNRNGETDRDGDRTAPTGGPPGEPSDRRSPDGNGPPEERRRSGAPPPEFDRPRPWHARIRPALERTVGTFGAAGVGVALMGAIGALLLTEGGAGEYGDFVVAWAFGLIGIIAVGFVGTVLAAVTGVRTAGAVRGRAAYLAGGLGGFAGQVVLVGIGAVAIGATTQVALTGTIAVLALVSGVPAAVAGVAGVVVGRRLPPGGPPDGRSTGGVSR